MEFKVEVLHNKDMFQLGRDIEDFLNREAKESNVEIISINLNRENIATIVLKIN